MMSAFVGMPLWYAALLIGLVVLGLILIVQMMLPVRSECSARRPGRMLYQLGQELRTTDAILPALRVIDPCSSVHARRSSSFSLKSSQTSSVRSPRLTMRQRAGKFAAMAWLMLVSLILGIWLERDRHVVGARAPMSSAQGQFVVGMNLPVWGFVAYKIDLSLSSHSSVSMRA